MGMVPSIVVALTIVCYTPTKEENHLYTMAGIESVGEAFMMGGSLTETGSESDAILASETSWLMCSGDKKGRPKCIERMEQKASQGPPDAP